MMSNLYYVDEESADVRVDKYLSDLLPDLSRTFIQKLLKSGHILVNNNPCKSKYLIK